MLYSQAIKDVLKVRQPREASLYHNELTQIDTADSILVENIPIFSSKAII